MGTQQIVDFDMEITLTAQQRRVYPFTFKCNYKREDDIFTIASLLPMNVYVLKLSYYRHSIKLTNI